MFKRVGLFLMVNIAVMIIGSTVINFILSFFGMGPAQTAAGGLNYSSLMVICFLWGMIGSFISLSISRWIAKKMYSIEVLEVNGPHSQLVMKVHELARRAGLEVMPEVGIYQSHEVNAFATGPSRKKSLVAVSSGLLQQLNSDEVEGVLAHEIAHIANGDMVTMALVQGIVNAFVMFLARVATFAIDQAMRGNDDEKGGGLGFFAYFLLNNFFHIIFGMLTSPIVFAFSRWREYRADAGAAKIAGKEKMIAALEKLKTNLDALGSDKNIPQEAAMQTMQISSKGRMSAWFSTHPSLDDRIKRLQQMR